MVYGLFSSGAGGMPDAVFDNIPDAYQAWLQRIVTFTVRGEAGGRAEISDFPSLEHINEFPRTFAQHLRYAASTVLVVKLQAQVANYPQTDPNNIIIGLLEEPAFEHVPSTFASTGSCAIPEFAPIY